MTHKMRYPFRLDNAFFKALEFHRIPKLPEPLQFEITSEIRIHSGRFPEALQVDLKVSTAPEKPLTFCVELVGIFELVENQPAPDADMIECFVNERALHMLWPTAEQMIRLITSQMGMNPLKIPRPYEFTVALEEQTVAEPRDATGSESASGE